MKKKCTKCGNKFTPGVDGILDPVACDSCMGIKRDNQGHFWLPRERVHNYQVIETGEVIKVKRADAFGKAG